VKLVELETLGWSDALEAHWEDLRIDRGPGRVARIDRGWSSVWYSATGDHAERRVRNIGADVAVGDWAVVSDDDERVEAVVERTSAFVRRASFEGMRATADVIAANIDVVMLVHSLNSPPNQRRLERELVLAFDSGARPVVVLTKADIASPSERTSGAVAEVALNVPVHVASGLTGEGVDALRHYADHHRTVALLGASGVGKSTLVNALVGSAIQETASVREADQRGRHTTTAVELVGLSGGGWLIDTPGVRAVSLWTSGRGIERAFADVFELMDHCRFRDCKHDDEPDCAVQQAVSHGRLDVKRLESMKRLVAEEQALEHEQWEWVRAQDKRGRRKGPR
jgi:ribosome biogenesis GTPase